MSSQDDFMRVQRSPHSELHALLARLQHITCAVQSYTPIVPDLPIIFAREPSSNDLDKGRKDALPGLRLLKEEINRECMILKALLEDLQSQSKALRSFSTNAPYLIAVWQELINSYHPVAIYRTFSLENDRLTPRESKQSSRPVKVDVVTEGGKQWIRVNTIKNSRIMVEFRELDSYFTDASSGESDSDGFTHKGDSSGDRGVFDNSVLRMGRELLAAAAAAAANPLAISSHVPRITIRLTRLCPTFVDCHGVEADPRIAHTVERLQEMGIDVQLGEQPDVQRQQEHLQPRLDPTLNVNLDLSTLIALISDITHAPLPLNTEEAQARFTRRKVPAAKEIKSGGSICDVIVDADADAHAEELLNDENGQARALSLQLIQEMNSGLLENMHTRLSALYEGSLSSVQAEALEAGVITTTSLASHLGNVRFWTTQEARQRCLEIVAKIGGPREQRRAHALLPARGCFVPSELIREGVGAQEKWDKEAAEMAYWEYSRYPFAYLSLVPVHVIPSRLSPTSSLNDGTNNLGSPPHPLSSVFFSALSTTCTELLAECADKQSCTEIPVVSGEGHSGPTVPDVIQGLSIDHHPDYLTAPIPCTSKLTRHTVASMYAGASRCWTTLTANRASVRELLKEMKKRGKGSEPGILVFGDNGSGKDIAATSRIQAAIWIINPRSLAEGMVNDSNV
ncbi:hypothetical protein V8B97DRAFT_1943149 [Scleroderma yunnanense]